MTQFLSQAPFLMIIQLANPKTDSRRRKESEERRHPRSKVASRRYRKEARTNPQLLERI